MRKSQFPGSNAPHSRMRSRIGWGDSKPFRVISPAQSDDELITLPSRFERGQTRSTLRSAGRPHLVIRPPRLRSAESGESVAEKSANPAEVPHPCADRLGGRKPVSNRAVSIDFAISPIWFRVEPRCSGVLAAAATFRHSHRRRFSDSRPRSTELVARP